jgi:FAD/FMN-containing dehydrogenase
VFEPGEERVGEKLLPLSEGLPLARGLGRAYGDSALPAAGQAAVLGTRLANRILSWDPDTRLLRGEAGLSLYEVNHLFFHRGFFTPVTPERTAASSTVGQIWNPNYFGPRWGAWG